MRVYTPLFEIFFFLDITEVGTHGGLRTTQFSKVLHEGELRGS